MLVQMLAAIAAVPSGAGTDVMVLSSLVPQRNAKQTASFDDLGPPIRLVVLACKRPLALNALLINLNSVGEAGGYEGHSVPLLISIDTPRGKLAPPADVVALANDFDWAYGEKTIRLQQTHQGILGQWLMLRTPPASPWMAVLEDDLALSPCFYSYLLRARKVFGQREDISGFTLQKHGPCLTESEFCAARDVPMNQPYIVRCVGSWGFMPTPSSWTHFIEWQAAHRNTTSPTADLPKQLVHHKWYDEFVRKDKLDSFWTVWHLAFTHAFGKGTLVAELPEPLARPHGQQPSEHGNEPDRPGSALAKSLRLEERDNSKPVLPIDNVRVPTPRPASLGPLALNLKSALNLAQISLDLERKEGRFPSLRWGEEDRDRRAKAKQQRDKEKERRAKEAAARFVPAAYDPRSVSEANPDALAAMMAYQEGAEDEALEIDQALLRQQTVNVKLAKALRSGGGAELAPIERAQTSGGQTSGGPVAVPFLRSEVTIGETVASSAALSAPAAEELAANGATDEATDEAADEVADEDSRGCCVVDTSTLQAGGNQTCIDACAPGQNCCGPCDCPGCPHHAESHVDPNGFCVMPVGSYRPPSLEELGLCTQCDAIRDPTAAFWSATPVAFDYDGRRMEWPPAPKSTNMPSLNSSIELVAKNNRRRLLLEAASQRHAHSVNKGYVGHGTSVGTGGSRHHASDDSYHVTMFSRRDDGSSSSIHSSSGGGSSDGSSGSGSGSGSYLAKTIARNLGGGISSSRSDRSGPLAARASTDGTSSSYVARRPELLPLSTDALWRRH